MVAIPENTLVVGQLAGVFGVRGWIKIRSFTRPESNILSYSPWWLKTPSGLKKVEVIDHKLRPQGLVVQLKDIDDRDVAAQLGKLEIVVDSSQLPDLLEGDYYLHQLLGLKVISVFSGAESVLGAVADIMETGANDVLVVSACSDSIDDQERLIPYMREQYVIDINIEKGEIRVDWDPEF